MSGLQDELKDFASQEQFNQLMLQNFALFGLESLNKKVILKTIEGKTVEGRFHTADVQSCNLVIDIGRDDHEHPNRVIFKWNSIQSYSVIEISEDPLELKQQASQAASEKSVHHYQNQSNISRDQQISQSIGRGPEGQKGQSAGGGGGAKMFQKSEIQGQIFSEGKTLQDLKEDLDDIKNKRFNQFQVNEVKFNIKSQFDQSKYTSTLDLSTISEETRKKAELLQRELLEESKFISNKHILEERGVQQLQDPQPQDQQALYSAVLETGGYENIHSLDSVGKQGKVLLGGPPGIAVDHQVEENGEQYQPQFFNNKKSSPMKSKEESTNLIAQLTSFDEQKQQKPVKIDTNLPKIENQMEQLQQTSTDSQYQTNKQEVEEKQQTKEVVATLQLVVETEKQDIQIEVAAAINQKVQQNNSEVKKISPNSTETKPKEKQTLKLNSDQFKVANTPVKFQLTSQQFVPTQSVPLPSVYIPAPAPVPPPMNQSHYFPVNSYPDYNPVISVNSYNHQPIPYIRYNPSMPVRPELQTEVYYNSSAISSSSSLDQTTVKPEPQTDAPKPIKKQLVLHSTVFNDGNSNNNNV